MRLKEVREMHFSGLLALKACYNSRGMKGHSFSQTVCRQLGSQEEVCLCPMKETLPRGKLPDLQSSSNFNSTNQTSIFKVLERNWERCTSFQLVRTSDNLARI
jgi:hypothetical protein